MNGFNFCSEYCERLRKLNLKHGKDLQAHAQIGSLEATIGIILSRLECSNLDAYNDMVNWLNILNPKIEE